MKNEISKENGPSQASNAFYRFPFLLNPKFNLVWAALPIGFTLFFWLFTENLMEQKRSDRVRNHLEDFYEKTEAEFKKIESALLSLRAHYSQFPSRLESSQDFKSFLAESNTSELIPGIQALAYARTYSSAKEAFEIISSQKSQGRPLFKIWPQSQESLKTTITNIFPEDSRNLKAVGYDMFTETNRREAMTKSLESGKITMTHPIHLVQDSADLDKNYGFIIYLPFYGENLQGNPQTQYLDLNISGFFYSVIRTEDFFKSILNQDDFEERNFEISIKTSQNASPLFSIFQSQKILPQSKHIQSEFSFFSKKFVITCYEVKTFDVLLNEIIPIAVLVFGLITSFLALFLFRSVQLSASDQVRLKTAALDAAEKAKAANLAKSAFLANMSHEIRTPLGVIMGYSDMLAKEDLSKEKKSELVSIIKKNGLMLSRLLEDILDSSKIEAGKLKIDPQSILIEDLVSQVDSIARSRCVSKGIEFHVEKSNQVPEAVILDEQRALQVITNLINNAIRFTEKGSVTLKYGCLKRGSKKYLFFDVIDTGVGIQKEFHKSLFRNFEQADVSTTRKFGGTGLGLSLSKNLAKLMGGDVVLKSSQPQKGSHFRVRFMLNPAKPPAKSKSLESKTQQVEAKWASKKILLVEDSPENQVIVKHFLKDTQVEMDTASDGKEALQKGVIGDYDLILMDVQIPFKDGKQVTRELLAMGVKTPIIALTAHAQKSEIMSCLEAGCVAHVSKPVDKNILVQTISRFIN